MLGVGIPIGRYSPSTGHTRTSARRGARGASSSAPARRRPPTAEHGRVHPLARTSSRSRSRPTSNLPETTHVTHDARQFAAPLPWPLSGQRCLRRATTASSHRRSQSDLPELRRDRQQPHGGLSVGRHQRFDATARYALLLARSMGTRFAYPVARDAGLPAADRQLPDAGQRRNGIAARPTCPASARRPRSPTS